MFSGCLCKEETIFSPAKICSSNPWRVSRGQQRIMEESEDIKGSTYLQMWQLLLAQEEGEQAGGKTLNTCREFFALKKVLSLCNTDLGERGSGKAYLLYKVEKLIPHFCNFLSWSVTEWQQHFHVSCWFCFTSSLKTLERRRKNAAEPGFVNCHTGWFLYQKPRPKALRLGAIHGDRGLLCRALYKHPGRAMPVTKDLLSKQRRLRNNSRRIRNQLTSPESHGLVRTPEAEAWRSDFQPSNLLFLTASHLLPLWCLRGVNGTKDNCGWLGIFNYGELYIQAHTRWTWLPPGCPLLALKQLGGCSESDSKVTLTAEMPHKQREEGTAPAKSGCRNTFTSCNTKPKNSLS